MLFRESDFVEPRESKLWPALLEMDDLAVRHLAGHLLAALRRPRADMPSLEHIAPGGEVRPFNIGEQASVRAWLGMSGPNPWLWQPPPPPPRPSLLPPGPVELQAGKPQSVAVKIDRQGFPGPLVLRCEGLPDKIQVASGVVNEGECSGVLVMKAALSADMPPGPVTLSLWSEETQLDECRFNVSVSAARVPRLAKLAPITLRAGGERTLMIPIALNDWKEPVSLRVEGLPDGVTSPGSRPALKAFMALRLKAGPDAKPGMAAATVSLWAGNSQVDEKRLTITVEPAEALAAPRADADR
jgi:hypothetical protein